MSAFNRQDIFDRALAHLRKQGKRAVEGTYCRYRGPNGSACAIGGLIPDERYSVDLEGAAADVFDVVLAMGFDPDQLSPDDGQFPLYLQRDLHDSLPDDGFPSALEAAAKTFAAKYKLRFTPIPGDAK